MTIQSGSSYMPYRKKLIEVALPLAAINMESVHEKKSTRNGHPSRLHLWWSRKPTATARAVLWASLVDDPSSWPDKFPTEEEQKRERQRLFDILGRIAIEIDTKGRQNQVVQGLVSWNEVNLAQSLVLEAAQLEIARCLAWSRGEDVPNSPSAVQDYIARYAPPACDPFSGGGSIPLEAQRLGLKTYASDLNPVAVLISKALVEIPPRFRDLPPVNPAVKHQEALDVWRGAQGLAADVEYYGTLLRDEAFRQIGHHYPERELPHEAGSGKATVIAWLWVRTVKCANPACGCQMPLTSKFSLSTKKGKETWANPVIDRSHTPPTIRFEVSTGPGEPPKGTVERKGARCIVCDTPIPFDFVRSEGRTGRLRQQMIAVVAKGSQGRAYLSPTEEDEQTAIAAQPKWQPETDLPKQAIGFRVQRYGITKHAELFTSRQLLALTTFCDLVNEIRQKVTLDAIAAGMPDDEIPLSKGGSGATAYGEAVSVYLAFAIDKCSDYWSSISPWNPQGETMSHVFTRQAIAMSWDFAEANPFSDSSGNYLGALGRVAKVVAQSCNHTPVKVTQHNATLDHPDDQIPKLISTDPPYYDAVPYGDLSDFFYVWLRRSVGSVYPEVCSTVLVPKAEEMFADMYRHGSRRNAREFFESSLVAFFQRVNRLNHPDYPVTVYYALKQIEVNSTDNSASTGWETILEGLIQANFSIRGTWPIRTEQSNRMRGQNSNALASSIVLVCRPRPVDAPQITRRQFLSELKTNLPPALKTMQQGNIAPVDFDQASIGPGMAVFSQYAAVLESDGSRIRVSTALKLINQILDEFLAEQEGEFDGDTRWALTWFQQHQFGYGQYGDAEMLSKAKNTSVTGLVEAGILEAKGGKVRLLPRDELPGNWNPETDTRSPDWEITQHLIRELDHHGELGAARLLAKLGGRGEIARDLAYRLYKLCDQKGWAQEGVAYNSLVIAWPELTRLVSEVRAEPIETALGVLSG